MKKKQELQKESSELWLQSDPEKKKQSKSIQKKSAIERKQQNIKPHSSISRALLAKQFSELKQYQKFAEKWLSGMNPAEALEMKTQMDQIYHKLQVAAYAELIPKAADMAVAVLSGMTELKESDIEMIAAWSIYWALYRISDIALNPEVLQIKSWAMSFSRIHYEATATGTLQQKNQISNYTLHGCEKLWIEIQGSAELLILHKNATLFGLDTQEIVSDLKTNLFEAYKNLPQMQLGALDYVLKHKMSK